MLRIVGLALLFVVGVAAPAEANDRSAGGATSIAAHEGRTGPGRDASMQGHTTPVPLTGALAAAQSLLHGMAAADSSGELAPPSVGLAALPPERRERGGSLTLSWVSQGKAGLRLPLSERLSFALGYRHVEPEDLARRFAEAGSVDYDSHDFLLRAHWRF